MFQRIKNAVSSAFEEKSLLPPPLPLEPTRKKATSGSDSSAAAGKHRTFVPSIISRHGQRAFPSLVACDSQLGLIASIVCGDHLIVYELRSSDMGRFVIPIREDQTWHQAEFIVGTGLLLILSDSLLMLVDVDRALRSGCSEDGVSTSLFIRPSSAHATCMSVLTGTSLIAVGCSDAKVRFAKFCGLSSDTADKRLFQWSQHTADLFVFLSQDNTPVFCDRPEPASPDVSSPTGSEGGFDPEDGYEIVCCEQYPNDPNALVAVMMRTIGITKFYAVENRLSAFFVLPVELQAEPIVACAVTPGGGFVLGLQRQRICIWNEQSAKRKDRTVPVHFVVDLPFAALVGTLRTSEEDPSLHLNTMARVRSCGLWLATTDSLSPGVKGHVPSSSSLTAVFVSPESASAICEVRLNCEAKIVEAIQEHAATNVELATSNHEHPTALSFLSLRPWVSSPWMASWSASQDFTTFVACADHTGLVVLSLASGTKGSSGLCQATPIRYLAALPPTSTNSGTLLMDGASITNVAPPTSCETGRQLPAARVLQLLPVRGRPLHVLQQRQLYPELRREIDKFIGLRTHAVGSPSVCIGPMFDVCAPVTTQRFPLSAYRGCKPTGWNHILEPLTVSVFDPLWTVARSLKVVVYTTSAVGGEEEEEDMVSSQMLTARLLVCAVVDEEERQVVTFSESNINIMPQEGLHDSSVPDIKEVRILYGSWRQQCPDSPPASAPEERCMTNAALSGDDAYGTSGPRTMFVKDESTLSAVVQLCDGSFVFQNLARSRSVEPPSVVLPAILFPASDPIVSFECVTGLMERQVKQSPHVDPAQPLSAPAFRTEMTLFLFGLTRKMHIVLIDISRMQVLGMRPVLPSPSSNSGVTSPLPMDVGSLLSLRTTGVVSAPPPLIPRTIFPWNKPLAHNAVFRLPRNVAVEINVAALTSVVGSPVYLAGGVTFAAPAGSGGSPLTIAFDIRSITARDEPAEQNETDALVENNRDNRISEEGEGAAQASLDDPSKAESIVFSWEVSSHGALLVPRRSTTVCAVASQLPSCATACMVFVAAERADGRGSLWTASCRIEGDNCLSECLSSTDECSGPMGLVVGEPLVGSCNVQLNGGNPVCVEVQSKPSGLTVCSFTDMKAPPTTFASASNSLTVVPVVVQLSPQMLIAYEDASLLINAVAPPPPKKDKKSSNPSISSLGSVGTAMVQLPQGQNIACWALRRIFLREQTLDVLMVVSLLRSSGRYTLHMFSVGTSNPLPIIDPVALPQVFPFHAQLDEGECPPTSVRYDCDVVVVNEEVHVYCFMQHGLKNAWEAVHILLGEVSEAAPLQGTHQIATTWPLSRGLPCTHPPGSLCPHHVRTPAHLLPPAPSNATATQKEQGFFKRLIVSSRETQLEKLEALCALTAKETYEDMLDRIIAPAEKKLGLDRKADVSDAEQRRRELLGAKYNDAKHSGAARGGTKGAMDETRQQMNENLQLLHERGDKIDKVQSKSEMLADETAEFAKLCKQLKEKQRSRWF